MTTTFTSDCKNYPSNSYRNELRQLSHSVRLGKDLGNIRHVSDVFVASGGTSAPNLHLSSGSTSSSVTERSGNSLRLPGKSSRCQHLHDVFVQPSVTVTAFGGAVFVFPYLHPCTDRTVALTPILHSSLVCSYTFSFTFCCVVSSGDGWWIGAWQCKPSNLKW